MASQTDTPNWLDRPILPDFARLFTFENLLVVLILILAVASRFAMLGERVMSHDEVNHVVPSYDLFQGRGYSHDPVTHGPFQFHIVALSYFMFGDNDFSARIPAATFSVIAILFVLFAFRRYLGRTGALVAGFLFVISPFMLFYGRYTRNEGFIELLGVLQLYAMLRYLDKGDRLSMFLNTIAVAMHFCVKETSFIYVAQALIFLFIMFLVETWRVMRHNPTHFKGFFWLMIGAMTLVIVALGLGLAKTDQATPAVDTPSGPETPIVQPSLFDVQTLRLAGEGIALIGAIAMAVIALLILVRDIGWNQIRRMRSFSLLLLTGTLIFPILSAFPVYLLGWNPLDYSSSASILRTAVFVVIFFAIAIAIGWWWNARVWVQNAMLFYAIFTVFYTTFFTNGFGFFTGVVGSLGYWLAQQSVERGSQPLYYYALVQIPIYEFLAALGTLLAIYFGIRYYRFATLPGLSPADPAQDDQKSELTALEAPDLQSDLPTEAIEAVVATQAIEISEPDEVFSPFNAEHPEDVELHEMYDHTQRVPVLALLVFWSITSLIAYSLAGERMPWLTVHIALPMLLSAGWGFGFLIDRIEWKRIGTQSGLLAALLVPVLLAAGAALLGGLLGTNPPFQGSNLTQLQATSRFVVSLAGLLASAAGIYYLLRDWRTVQIFSLAGVVIFAALAVLTGRAAYRASYITYDQATEYLVYAHAARGPKDALAQIEEISRRTTGGKDIKVAYSNDGLYPYWWYLRDYPNKLWFQDKPTRELRDYPVIIAGEDVFTKIDTLVGDSYVRYEYMRLWWPNQEYYNLTGERIWNAIADPQMRSAIFDIWLNRDYTAYGKLIGKEKEFDLETWSPGAQMRLYIRKDIIAQIWDYGASPAMPTTEEIDPYAAKMSAMPIQQVLGTEGSAAGQFIAPRGLRMAADGSLYVADSKNNRIQHLSPDGQVLQTWGSYADRSAGDAPGGTFFEPWDVAIGLDGSVYVSDTWNHRIQKFTATGEFIKMWGYFGQGEAPDAFWGPRGLAVDAEGRLYVMDTGNDRVVVFDADGNSIAQFGTEGFDRGQLDEPTGIAIDQTSGKVFIADTWNQRIHIFIPSVGGTIFTPVQTWDIKGWLGESLENKPFIALSPANGHLYVLDPEGPRVIEFTQEGEYVRGWGDLNTGDQAFSIVSGIAISQDGQVWISDGAKHRLMRFSPPLQ